MIATFKANNPVNNFLLLVYSILLKLPLFLHPYMPQSQKIDGFLFKQLLIVLNPVTKGLPIIFSIITFILFYSQAIMLNNLANSQRLFAKPNYLVGMSYLLITSFFIEWQQLSAPLIINTIGIWVIVKMASLYNEQNVKTSLFNIGLFIGIGTFFYFPSAAFILLLFFGLAIVRPFKINEWAIALLGCITPYYFLAIIVFLANLWKGYKWPGIAISAPIFFKNNISYLAIGILIFTLLVGVLYVQKNFRRQLINARKTWSLFYLYILIASIIPFINATKTFSYWILCAVPFSMFVAAYFFYINNKWLSLISHWLMVIFVIIIGYFIAQ